MVEDTAVQSTYEIAGLHLVKISQAAQAWVASKTM
jgi:hypothetical protein